MKITHVDLDKATDEDLRFALASMAEAVLLIQEELLRRHHDSLSNGYWTEWGFVLDR